MSAFSGSAFAVAAFSVAAFAIDGDAVAVRPASKAWPLAAVQRHSYSDPVNSYWPIAPLVLDLAMPAQPRVWNAPDKDPSVAVVAVRRHYPFQKADT